MALEKLRNKIDSNALLIIYKLLIDVLFIEAIFFLLALVGEGLLPGVVTSRVGFSKIIIAIGVTLLAIFYLGNKEDVSLGASKPNKKTAYALVCVLILLLFISLIKINLILNIILSSFAVATGYFIYKIILVDNKKR